MPGGKSLSERAGFYIASGAYYYMTDNPAWLYAFAARFNISGRVMRYCKISLALLVVFLVTDIHRYGAWYNGGATYIKPWWQFACVLLCLPPLYVMFKCFFTFIGKSESLFIWIPVGLVLLFAICFLASCLVCMIDEGFYIASGYFFLRGYQLVEIAEGSLAFSVIFGVSLLLDIIKQWWDRLFGEEDKPERSAPVRP